MPNILSMLVKNNLGVKPDALVADPSNFSIMYNKSNGLNMLLGKSGKLLPRPQRKKDLLEIVAMGLRNLWSTSVRILRAGVLYLT